MTAATTSAPARRNATLDSLPDILVKRGLVDRARFVDSYVSIEDRSRRNRNFKVVVPDGPKLLVKQGSEGANGSWAAVESEARLLRTAATDPAFASIRWFSPKIVDYDEENQILATELIQPATTLTKYHVNLGNIHFPSEAGDTLGRLVASWHNAARKAWKGGRLEYVHRSQPFVAPTLEQLRRAPAQPTDVRSSYLKLVKEIVPYERHVAQIAEWEKEHKGVGHGDIRWDNVLITEGGGRGGNMNFRLIDWEMAYVGDPAWDVACYLGEYLRLWFMSTLGRQVTSVAEVESKAKFKLADTHESIAAFLDSYSRKSEIAAGKRPNLVPRLHAYLPYVVLLICYESLQRQAQFPPVCKVAIEMARDAIEDPQTKHHEWFGL